MIIDEAHSSQSGDASREMKEILGASSGETKEDEDWEDRLNAVMESRGPQANLSFYAFTATPKGKTLELFGRKPQGLDKPEAFHTYSMRQAIQEGFILDVLRNYTSYTTYYKLRKEAEDDPELPIKKASRALAKFMSLHETNIGQKTEVIIEHFRNYVMRQLGGRAKAMVVTSSRLHAVRYKLAFERYLKEHAYTDVRPLVAFSGTVKDPETELEYTEPGMNPDVVTGKPIGESQLPERFASPDYQVLLVANKYQTGFDQPLLCAMYVDKRLDGVQAVQTLSRLNRKIQGKEDPFVLDFVNDREDIYKAFKPYFDSTSLQESSDPSKLEQLKHELNQAQVYHWTEVEAFAKIFYKPLERQTVADHAHMQKHLQPAVDRFNAMEDDKERDEFRTRLLSFVNVYAFLSQIIPFADSELEMLASFGKFLIPHLPIDRGDPVRLANDVALHYYRLQQVASGAINVQDGESEGVKSPTDVGTGKAPEKKAPLSEIIGVLNERFGTTFTDEDRLFFEQIKEKAVKSQKVIDTALSNPLDKFQLGVKKLIEDLMIQRMAENDGIVTRYMDDEAFQGEAFPILAREIFASINASAGRKGIGEIIAEGEGNTTEFKSTLRVNLHTKAPDPKIEHSALKTIAAFLNSREGGALIIGVNDAGEALGLEADGFPNEDKMNLHLVNVLKARLNAASMLHIKPHFEDFSGKRILVVDCLPSGHPVYLKDGKIEEFYIRAGASSAALPLSEMTAYIQQRFSQ